MTAPISRTYQYDGRPADPAGMLGMSGLEFLQAILRGDAPAAPIAATLGFAPVSFERGRAVFEGRPERYALNPYGGVHGGWHASILDAALGCAIQTLLPAGKAYTTLDLSISFVRGLTERTGLVRCEAEALHVGGTVATARGRIVDASGTLYAHGTATCLVLTPRS